MIYLVVMTLSWIVAQGIKYLINALKTNNFKNTKPLRDSGRMPSAHSATTVSLALTIGLMNGFDSALFALAVLCSALTMYDAVKVRRVVGEHGTFLENIATSIVLKNVKLPRVAEGHKPLEVLVGGLIGTVIALSVYIIAH
jgi:acid phosphatase family membrane protein YuiD